MLIWCHSGIGSRGAHTKPGSGKFRLANSAWDEEILYFQDHCFVSMLNISRKLSRLLTLNVLKNIKQFIILTQQFSEVQQWYIRHEEFWIWDDVMSWFKAHLWKCCVFRVSDSPMSCTLHFIWWGSWRVCLYALIIQITSSNGKIYSKAWLEAFEVFSKPD